MLKLAIFLIYFVIFSVYCDVTAACSKSDTCKSSFDIAIDMLTKAKDETCVEFTESQLKTPVDCADIFDMGHKESGVFKIWPMNKIFDGEYIHVYCDMHTDGGGWTVIQRRGDFQNPIDYFYRNWENYKQGFGNVEEEFWLGNDAIFALTNQKLYSVRFDLRDVLNHTAYAVYDKFWIDDEDRMYTLHIDLYSGDAGDSMAYSNHLRFSTFDNGNVDNCSNMDKGGWWYMLSRDKSKCHDANLNGLNRKGKFQLAEKKSCQKKGSCNKDGITWQTFKGFDNSLEATEIKIRPKRFRADSS